MTDALNPEQIELASEQKNRFPGLLKWAVRAEAVGIVGVAYATQLEHDDQSTLARAIIIGSAVMGALGFGYSFIIDKERQ